MIEQSALQSGRLRYGLPVLVGVASVAIVVGSSLEPRLLLVGCLGLAIVLVILTRPFLGLLCMIAFFLIQNSPIYETYGVLPGVGSASDGLAVVVLAGYVLQSARTRHPIPKAHRYVLGTVLAYSVWQILSIAWSPAAMSDIVDFGRNTVEGLVLFGIVVLLVTTAERARTAALVYALTGIGLALYVIVNFQLHHGFDASLNQWQAYRGGLPQSFNPNEHAVELLMVPAFALLAVQNATPKTKILVACASCAIIGLALIILTSRESFIDIAAGILGAVILVRNFRHRLVLLTFLVLAGIALVVAVSSDAVPTYFVSRFSEAGNFGVQNAGGRLPGWQIGLQLYSQVPFAGLGAMGFEHFVPSYHVNVDWVVASHSDYMRSLTNSGIVGLLLLLAMLVAFGRVFVMQDNRNPLLIYIFVSLIVAMAAGDFLLRHFTWVVLSLAYCCAVTQSNRSVFTSGTHAMQTGDTSPVEVEQSASIPA